MNPDSACDDIAMLLKRYLSGQECRPEHVRKIQSCLSQIAQMKNELQDYRDCHKMLGQAGIPHGGPVSQRISSLVPSQPIITFRELPRLLTLVNRITGRSKKRTAERIRTYRLAVLKQRPYNRDRDENTLETIRFALKYRHTSIDVCGRKNVVFDTMKAGNRNSMKSHRGKRADKSSESCQESMD